MAPESRLGEDLDVRPGANSYSGAKVTALVVYETLDCSYTEQWVGVQSVNTIAVISRREPEGRNLSKIQSHCIREQTYLFHEQSRQSALGELTSFAPVIILYQG